MHRAVGALAALLCIGAGPALATDVVLKNSGSSPIILIEFQVSGSGDWSGILGPGSSLEPGASRNLSIVTDDCDYDFWAAFADDSDTRVNHVDTCANDVVPVSFGN